MSRSHASSRAERLLLITHKAVAAFRDTEDNLNDCLSAARPDPRLIEKYSRSYHVRANRVNALIWRIGAEGGLATEDVRNIVWGE